MHNFMMHYRLIFFSRSISVRISSIFGFLYFWVFYGFAIRLLKTFPKAKLSQKKLHFVKKMMRILFNKNVEPEIVCIKTLVS